MSGASNVHYWLTRRNIQADEQLVDAILSNAKATNRTLAEEEIMAIVRKHKS